MRQCNKCLTDWRGLITQASSFVFRSLTSDSSVFAALSVIKSKKKRWNINSFTPSSPSIRAQKRFQEKKTFAKKLIHSLIAVRIGRIPYRWAGPLIVLFHFGHFNTVKTIILYTKCITISYASITALFSRVLILLYINTVMRLSQHWTNLLL